MIIFDPVRHQYKNQFTGEEYISATTLLGKYKKPFDSATAAERVAKREGKTVEQVLGEWKKLNTDSQIYGTQIHKAIEDFNNTGVLPDEHTDIVQSYIELGIINRDKDELLNEQRLWLHQCKIAGTADIIRHEERGGFSVFDIKTNKKFNYFSAYNEQMLYPLNHLSVCEYSTYSLQLSLYAYMYQTLTGRRLNQLGVLYYDRELKKFKYIPAIYMKTDVVAMLEHYAKG